MRFWDDHRIEDDNFQESIRGLVRNTPWWSISAIVHLLVLMVFSLVGMEVERPVQERKLQAVVKEKIDELEEPEKFIPPETELQPVDEPQIDETTLSEDTDQQEDSPDGIEGDLSGPFEAAEHNTNIGLNGGARGGKGKGGPSGRGNGSKERIPTDPQMKAGLDWLAKHQDVDGDGKWDCDDYMKHDPANDRCDGPGNQLYDVGVSGLALLSFLGAGYTDRGPKDTPFVQNVRKGLRYLIRTQDPDGCFGPRTSKHFMYNHAIASLAMAEAYWLTRNVRYKRPAQKALDFIARSRNSYAAWRYEPRGGENDLSVTGWMIMALKSGKYAGLLIDPDAFEGARRFVDTMTDPEYGIAGYDSPGGGSARPEGMQDKFPVDKTASMTAVAILTRIFLGEDLKSDMIRKGAGVCAERLPKWDPEDGSIDMYYWYYGSLALFQVGGTPWKKWNKAMVPAIVKSQHQKGSGSRSGSWDPIGPWGMDGGRVYSTAMMVMCLQVYYRYDRVVGIGRPSSK
jgi:hypothetical protein